ncbi:hypothetical protein DFR29_14111 [Tahibacter aquaticus]|uniref:Thioredoxin family protein n=1 Tax=Tahibacter aquaticus TaxID=520092 RepID=A0A4R6YFD0_9GAMM|nr:hypothetical protein [Tahibacter aquaticus]TDR34965.1 hypothetical protein DFR29_14111 [Tahibacter aquaticus]
MLDPWQDAAFIAQSLQQPGMRLVLAAGSETCLKCALIHAVFEQHAASAPPGELWLWLWREEHTPFLSGIDLADPPRFWIYQGANLVRSGPMHDERIGNDRESFVATVPHCEPASMPLHGDIRQRLLAGDWAR